MISKAHARAYQQLLAHCRALFSLGPGPAAARTAALLRAVGIDCSRSSLMPLAPGDSPCRPPAALDPLLQTLAPAPYLAALRASYRRLGWYRSGRAKTPCAQLVGPGCLFPHSDCRVGFMLLGPEYVYPHHVHGADEVYIVIAGSGEWSLHHQPYRRNAAGAIIEVPSMAVHALRTRTEPALLLWSWTGDISLDGYRYIDPETVI